MSDCEITKLTDSLFVNGETPHLYPSVELYVTHGRNRNDYRIPIRRELQQFLSPVVQDSEIAFGLDEFLTDLVARAYSRGVDDGKREIRNNITKLLGL